MSDDGFVVVVGLLGIVIISLLVLVFVVTTAAVDEYRNWKSHRTPVYPPLMETQDVEKLDRWDRLAIGVNVVLGVRTEGGKLDEGS